jgi:prepilin-type N-terminal cleavage/methylation domain-containing protein
MSKTTNHIDTEMITINPPACLEKDHFRPNSDSGFSTIELLVTILIMLVIAAIAIPNFMRQITLYKSASTARSISDLIQRTRYEAIKRNTKVTCHFALGATSNAWIDINGTGVLANNDPKVIYPAPMLSTGSALPGTASMNFPTVTAVAAAGTITFDSRGAVDYTGVPGGQTVWVLYFTYNNDANYGAKAVTVEPMGRTKVWTANPGTSTWQSQ